MFEFLFGFLVSFCSVNIEETDLYVPGTSKQTLDNLARENARLRSLLKNAEHQSGKKALDVGLFFCSNTFSMCLFDF